MSQNNRKKLYKYDTSGGLTLCELIQVHPSTVMMLEGRQGATILKRSLFQGEGANDSIGTVAHRLVSTGEFSENKSKVKLRQQTELMLPTQLKLYNQTLNFNDYSFFFQPLTLYFEKLCARLSFREGQVKVFCAGSELELPEHISGIAKTILKELRNDLHVMFSAALRPGIYSLSLCDVLKEPSLQVTVLDIARKDINVGRLRAHNAPTFLRMEILTSYFSKNSHAGFEFARAKAVSDTGKFHENLKESYEAGHCYALIQRTDTPYEPRTKSSMVTRITGVELEYARLDTLSV